MSEPSEASGGDLPAFLNIPRGHPIPISLQDQPPVPEAIESLPDLAQRQQARELWSIIYKFDCILQIWIVFAFALRNRLGLDASSQLKVSTLFPELKTLGHVLERIARREDGEGTAGDSSFQELIDLMLLIRFNIIMFIQAISSGDVRREFFEIVDLSAEMKKVINFRADATCVPSKFEVDLSCISESIEMRNRVAELRDQLAIIPTSVLAPAAHPPADTPRWDAEHRKLWLGSTLCKEFRRQPAPNQVTILDAFQEEGGWSRIDDPLPPKKGQTEAKRRQRLKDAVKVLRSIPGFRFRLDGTGTGIICEFSAEPPPSTPQASTSQ